MYQLCDQRIMQKVVVLGEDTKSLLLPIEKVNKL